MNIIITTKIILIVLHYQNQRKIMQSNFRQHGEMKSAEEKGRKEE